MDKEGEMGEREEGMTRKAYPSDISREQYELIREDLESNRRKTRPRKVDLYEIFCAVLYVFKSGCQWRMLPRDFPNWKLVYFYYSQWRQKPSPQELSLLERLLKKIGVKAAPRPWEEREN
jgi:transposase